MDVMELFVLLEIGDHITLKSFRSKEKEQYKLQNHPPVGSKLYLFIENLLSLFGSESSYRLLNFLCFHISEYSSAEWELACV